MSIDVTCKNCGEEYSVSESRAGTKVKCKVCHQQIRIPSGGGSGKAGKASPSKKTHPKGSWAAIINSCLDRDLRVGLGEVSPPLLGVFFFHQLPLVFIAMFVPDLQNSNLKRNSLSCQLSSKSTS